MVRESFPLVPATIAQLVLAAACVAWWMVDLPSIGGMHPAIKPLKFALSVAALLGTLALILPALSIDGRTRSILCWILALTMLVEMAAIVVQALRGQPSHYNARTTLDAAIWQAMLVAILVALGALVTIAIVATTRPLAFDPLVAFAVRIALWLLLLTAVSGFAMGGGAQHSVGGLDGGNGVPLVGWSRQHGDLRAPHFFAMHALQLLPGAALVLGRLAIGERTRWLAFGVVAIGWTALAVGTLLQAMAGRPFLR